MVIFFSKGLSYEADRKKRAVKWKVPIITREYNKGKIERRRRKEVPLSGTREE